jgi:aspartate kinase
MKFGGSSVADPARIAHVAERLIAAKERGLRVVGVVSAMGDTTDELLTLAHDVSAQPPPRELDMLLSVGEQISCALVAMAIREFGHESVSLTGPQAGILTDTTHGKAKIVDIHTLRIRAALGRGQVVLVTGFQGLGGGEITTLGRGGSDATAVALATALGAATCEIFTDVGGVYGADPRLVAEARKLDFVSYSEMSEIAAAGAAVLQLRAVELAQTHHVGLLVRSSLNDAEGTSVGREDERFFERPLISAVSHRSSEPLYRVIGADQADLFAALAAASVNVDTIIQIDDEIVFSATKEERDDVARALASLGLCWIERLDLGRITVVGGGLKSHPGIAADIFAVIRDLGLEAEFVSTSPIKISFYVPGASVEETVQALHARLRPGLRTS